MDVKETRSHRRIGVDRSLLGHRVRGRRLRGRALRCRRGRRRAGARAGGRRACRACGARPGRGRERGHGPRAHRREPRRCARRARPSCRRARRRRIEAKQRDLRRARPARPRPTRSSRRRRRPSWPAASPSSSTGRHRCLVAHPVNPPHLVPLVELVGAPWTAPAIVAKAKAIYQAVGQVPIVVKREIEGFILNRLQAVLLSEAFRLVERRLRHAAGSRQHAQGRSRPALVVHGAVRDHRAQRSGRHSGLLPPLRAEPGAAERRRTRHLSHARTSS